MINVFYNSFLDELQKTALDKRLLPALATIAMAGSSAHIPKSMTKAHHRRAKGALEQRREQYSKAEWLERENKRAAKGKKLMTGSEYIKGGKKEIQNWPLGKQRKKGLQAFETEALPRTVPQRERKKIWGPKPWLKKGPHFMRKNIGR